MSWKRKVMASLTESDISTIESSLRSILERIRIAYESAPIESRSSTIPRLVAASKTKPAAAVLAAYRFGQRNFGENYVQELISKANDPLIAECADIRWHFIGHLQTNKIAKLIQSVPNLFAVETVDSEKCARMLDDAVARKGNGEKLRVMVEVNTSEEEQKSGVPPHAAVELANFVIGRCSSLQFVGFMTIGSLDGQGGETNPDFARLVETRKEFCRENSADEKSIELSMGMSADFEIAIRSGSTSVRVGTSIFGSRTN